MSTKYTSKYSVYHLAELQSSENENYILVDDNVSVELLGMHVIDEFIQNEVGYYKELFEKEEISGLLNNLQESYVIKYKNIIEREVILNNVKTNEVFCGSS